MLLHIVEFTCLMRHLREEYEHSVGKFQVTLGPVVLGNKGKYIFRPIKSTKRHMAICQITMGFQPAPSGGHVLAENPCYLPQNVLLALGLMSTDIFQTMLLPLRKICFFYMSVRTICLGMNENNDSPPCWFCSNHATL